MESNQGTMIINPNFQDWCMLEDMEKKSRDPSEFQSGFYGESENLRWNEGAQWPSKRSPEGAINRVSIALMVTVCLLAITSLALTTLMLFGIIGSAKETCVCPQPGKHSKLRPA